MPTQIKLDSKKFQGHFTKMSRRMARYMEYDLPRIVGTEAVNHFKKSFDDEGFTGTGLSKWKPAKRTNPNSIWYGFQYQARTRMPNNNNVLLLNFDGSVLSYMEDIFKTFHGFTPTDDQGRPLLVFLPR